MLTLKLAWRNLWRHTRRTLLTATAIALGLALVLVFLGLQDGQHAQMIESAARMGSGHVLFQAPGYQRQRRVDLTLPNDVVMQIQRWAQLGPNPVILPRAYVSGLLSSADGATGVQAVGILPQREAAVSRFVERIKAGRYLAADDEATAVVGSGVARVLKVQVGSKVVLMAQGPGSSDIRSLLLRVTGIVRTGLEEFDESLLLLPLPALQGLLGLGDRVHQVALILPDQSSSARQAESARAAFPQVEVLSWAQADPQLDAFVKMDDGGSYLFDGLFFLLIAFMVLNTLLMSVLERRRELSLLGALGLSPRRRLRMVLIEAVLLSGISCGAGTFFGWLGHKYFQIHGLPLAWFTQGDFEAGGVILDPVMYSILSPTRILATVAMVFGLTMLLALVAARPAVRPVEVNLLK